MEEDRHPWRQMALMLIAMSVAMWMEMPEWQREHLTRVARQRARRMLGWFARRTGHRAMTHELAGRDDAASVAYALAGRLSQIRDRLS